MSKLSDNDIKKALECCIAKENCEEISCEKCPLERCADCDTVRFINALDLINRQQEEKETMQQYIDCLRAEIERLGKELIKQQLKNNMLYETAKEAKAEAVKEFEKLVTRRLNCNPPRGAYLLNIMNEVKKETTEQSVNYGSSKTE